MMRSLTLILLSLTACDTCPSTNPDFASTDASVDGGTDMRCTSPVTTDAGCGGIGEGCCFPGYGEHACLPGLRCNAPVCERDPTSGCL